MPFTEDLTAFFQPGDFATTVTWNGATVNGIFDAAYVEPLTSESIGPQLMCAQADVDGVAHGDTVLVDAVTYKVVNVQPDGTGVVTLRLERQ